MDIQLYTIKDYLDITRLPENENKRLELVDGVIKPKGNSNSINSIIAALIASFLNVFVLAKKLGYVTGADGGYKLREGLIYIPDAAFISKTRASDIKGNIFPVAPDLAVEVISKSETAAKVRKKVRDYLEAGTQLVWTVYPDEKLVEVHRLNESSTLLTDVYRVGDTLNGGGVLPDFMLEVQTIFPE